MKVIRTVAEMQLYTTDLKRQAKKVGLVPTMGYLHEGHLSLVKRAKELADEVVVSIFVNPTQFAPNEDYSKYPRDEKRDCALLEELGVSAVFTPVPEEIYPGGHQTYVEVTEISRMQEGEFRPTHFKGVTTIVSILFNTVMPDVAVFGQKDAQQAEIIKRMVKDLHFNLKVEVAPIVRESDGLAKSSRNIYLSQQERQDALVLSRSLKRAEELIKGGASEVRQVVEEMNAIITSVSTSELDYIRVVDADNFQEISEFQKGHSYYILIACRIGKTRLIDNIIISVD